MICLAVLTEDRITVRDVHAMWAHYFIVCRKNISKETERSLYSFVTTFFRMFPEDQRDVRWLYFYARENEMSSLAVQTHESVRHEGLCPSCTLISPWDTSISFFILLLYTLCVQHLFSCLVSRLSRDESKWLQLRSHFPAICSCQGERHEGRLERKERQEHADYKETLLLSWDTDNSVKDIVILGGHHRLSRRYKRSMSKSFVKGHVLWYNSKKKERKKIVSLTLKATSKIISKKFS